MISREKWMTRRDLGKTLAAALGSLGVPAMCPMTQAPSLLSTEGGEQRHRLGKNFGISVVIDPKVEQYNVLLNGQPWGKRHR